MKRINTVTEDREGGDPGARVVKMSILFALEAAQLADSKKYTGLNCFFEDGEVLGQSNKDVKNLDCFSLV